MPLRFLASLVVAMVVGGAANLSRARAQAEETAVRIITVDGVTLRGQFYPGTKKSPCLIMLHDLGEIRHDKKWRQLADALHDAGFAVLQFHFRGHGRSTEVDPDQFWSAPFAANRSLVRSRNKEEIEFTDFDSRYHPYLINDIAAVKAYLDRKNDEEECNSSNVVVLGSGKGATLGAAWIHSEMHRYRLQPAAAFGVPPQLAAEPEGANLLGALFINISSYLGKRKVSPAAALQNAGRRYKIPMVFFCGSEDRSGKALAMETEKAIDTAGKLVFTGVTEIPDAGADETEERVLSDNIIQKDVVRYLKQIHEDRVREWQEREWREAIYLWRNPYAPAALIRANQAGNNLPAYGGYDLFLPAR